jgi:diketogulonate reductase-like aldo/keto reductase
MASPTLKLNNGAHMPQVGFGLWKVDNATCADTVYNAIKVGYRLFDGACGKLPSPSHPMPFLPEKKDHLI